MHTHLWTVLDSADSLDRDQEGRQPVATMPVERKDLHVSDELAQFSIGMAQGLA